MSDINILLLDPDQNIHNQLVPLLKEKFAASVTSFLDASQAGEACKANVYSLMIVEPMCPASFDGEEFIKEQRQFYSINIENR